MKIAGIDIETTGLDALKGHKIIEVAINIFDYQNGVVRKQGNTWTQRINPMRAIDPAAQAVHHISLADLQKSPVFATVAPTIYKLMNYADVLVAHNVEFDIPFVGFELEAVKCKMPDFIPYCTLENGRSCTPYGTVPSLGAMCWAMDVAYDPNAAHAADYDIDKTMECYFKGLVRGVFQLPEQFSMQKVA